MTDPNTLNQVDIAIRAGIGIGNAAKLEQVRQQNEINALRASTPYVPMASTTDADVDDLTAEVAKLKVELAQSRLLIAERDRLIAERDRLIAERDTAILSWILLSNANESLMKTYAARLGIGEKQMRTERRKEIIRLAAEDPKYANSEFVENVRISLAKESE